MKPLAVAIALLWAPMALPAHAEPIHQLRIYEIFEGNKQAFHERFRDHGARIMARHGFRILSMWESRFEGRTEFVYVLEWPDEARMKAAWAAFMAVPEWAAIKRTTAAKHGTLVGRIQDRTLWLTDYAPFTSPPARSPS